MPNYFFEIIPFNRTELPSTPPPPRPSWRPPTAEATQRWGEFILSFLKFIYFLYFIIVNSQVGNNIAELLVPEMGETVDQSMLAALMSSSSMISAGASTEDVSYFK